MSSADRVRIPLLWDSVTKFWGVIVLLAVAGVALRVWFWEPEHRTGVITGFPIMVLLAYILLPRTWLEPSTGTVIFREVAVFTSRHLLRPGSTVVLRPLDDTLVLLVASPRGDRHGVKLALLRGTEAGLASQSPDLLRTVARTLQQHCPTVAPDTVALLTAQADHLGTGRPVLESPLAQHLLDSAGAAR